MSEPVTPQRRWRAACPNCGAPVEFASAASPVAVCSFCRSTLAREGEALRRIGVSAELFDDHSPLQLGAAGRWQGEAFSVVGRLQLAYAQGRWNEWHVLFDNGRSGWLAEDNGRYVMSFAQELPAPLPAPRELLPGAVLTLQGLRWQVASAVDARIEAAQGELPAAPRLQGALRVVELRSADDAVGSLEYGGDGQGPDAAAPAWSIGRPVALAELALTGLREASEAALGARGVECPACGTALQIRLDSTRSIVCHQCHAVVDLSAGVGGDLAHFQQQAGTGEGGGPQIPLGATGRLALGGETRDWQVVGYVERCEEPEDPDDDTVFWREYLLYTREVGFAFLVDAGNRWSWMVPLAGAPEVQGYYAHWKGRDYERLAHYNSRITWVLGEFYWRLQRDERTVVTDYASGPRRMSREQTGSEVTWSEGAELSVSTVPDAFGLKGERGGPPEPGMAPFRPETYGRSLFLSILFVIVGILLVLLLLRACSRDECDPVRDTFGASSVEYEQCRQRGRYTSSTSGGSYGGGWGGGGGHK